MRKQHNLMIECLQVSHKSCCIFHSLFIINHAMNWFSHLLRQRLIKSHTIQSYVYSTEKWKHLPIGARFAVYDFFPRTNNFRIVFTQIHRHRAVGRIQFEVNTKILIFFLVLHHRQKSTVQWKLRCWSVAPVASLSECFNCANPSHNASRKSCLCAYIAASRGLMWKILCKWKWNAIISFFLSSSIFATTRYVNCYISGIVVSVRLCLALLRVSRRHLHTFHYIQITVCMLCSKNHPILASSALRSGTSAHCGSTAVAALLSLIDFNLTLIKFHLNK